MEQMRFWTFNFVFNQNEAIFNVKLEHNNFGLATYFIYYEIINIYLI